MLFNYQALENSGKRTSGSIEAVSLDVAVGALQRRGLIISEINPADKESWLSKIKFGSGVSHKEVVMLSRQMATLFEAQVSALKIFTLLSSEVENQSLKRSLIQITDDLQAGSNISKALAKHPGIFSDFDVNSYYSQDKSDYYRIRSDGAVLYSNCFCCQQFFRQLWRDFASHFDSFWIFCSALHSHDRRQITAGPFQTLGALHRQSL